MMMVMALTAGSASMGEGWLCPEHGISIDEEECVLHCGGVTEAFNLWRDEWRGGVLVGARLGPRFLFWASRLEERPVRSDARRLRDAFG